MNKYKFFLIAFIFFSQIASAQFLLEKFLDEPFNHTISSMQTKLKDKEIEETTILKYKSIVYFDYIEPVSIKVGYLFDHDGAQKGKAIMNGKENHKDAETLFNILLTALEKKFSKNYSKAELGKMLMINWKGLKDLSVILSKQDDKTMLTIVRK